MTPDEEAKLREKLELLDGSRGGKDSGRRSAVRVDDLRPLLQIRDRLQAAKAAGAAPTKAEFDVLIDDLEFMRARLYEVMLALQGKIL